MKTKTAKNENTETIHTSDVCEEVDHRKNLGVRPEAVPRIPYLHGRLCTGTCLGTIASTRQSVVRVVPISDLGCTGARHILRPHC